MLLFQYFSKKFSKMAKQTSVYKFTGKLDNLIGYRRKGVHCVRTMPQQVRQSTATKKASRNFGMASRKGRLVRRALAGQLEVGYDGSLVNRLNKALIQAGNHHLQGIEGFRFNQHTGLERFFSEPVVVSPQGAVHIPAQALRACKDISHWKIKAIAVRINFAEQRVVGANTVAATIDACKPFNGANLEVTVPGKGTLLIVLQIQGYKETNGKLYASGNRLYSAADIVAVIAPVTAKHTPARGNKMPNVSQLLPYQLPANSTDLKPSFIPRSVIQLQRE
jgi:hypothetical protein